MTPAGPPPFGEGADDPDGLGDGGANAEAPSDGPFRGEPPPGPGGWVPPEDRLWRHPSELHAAEAGSVPPVERWSDGAGETGSDERPVVRNRLAWASALVGAGAAAAMVAGGLMLADTGARAGPLGAPVANAAATTVVTTTSSVPGQLPAQDRETTRSIVSLEIATDHGTATGCAVAVAEGGLLATTADAVVGSGSVTALTADGRREKVRVVAVDRTSDVALLQVDDDLPVADFAAAGAEAGGQAMVIGVLPQGGRRTTRTVWSVGRILAPAATVLEGDARGLAAIAASVPFMPELPGDVLVRPDGTVLGIFDESGTAPGTGAMFLPADLVVTVSDDLADQGKVDHGWLGIKGTDTSVDADGTGGNGADPPGALVAGVDQNGPAVGVLQAGDVIESVDGDAVGSMAQLREDLYLLAPGVPVTLDVWQGGRTVPVEVDLASSP